MLKRLAFISILVVMVMTLAGVTAAQEVQAGPITQRVLERGRLICGVHPGLPGFGFVNDAGEYEGFDVDICRAIAAAVLGDASKVDFKPLNADQRQAAIQSEEVDVMSRNTTWTMTRDGLWGAIFAPTTFYDGQGLAVHSDSGITDLAGLDGATICVQSGTTTELNLADAFKQAGIAYTPLVFSEADPTWEAFVQGRCDAFTTDKSGIAGYVADDPPAYLILDETLSKEPLGPLSSQSDPQWADVIQWTIFGLIQAEEFGITSQNIDDYIQKAGEADDAYVNRVTPAVARFLGGGGNATGKNLAIANDFMVAVIRQVGNYGEIFDRNLGPDTKYKLPRGLNNLWTNGGLMYSPPFR